MARRGLQCKLFRTACKSDKAWKTEQQKPARIAATTAEDPFALLAGVLTVDAAAFKRNRDTGRDILFPAADLLSLRQINEFYADLTHVWQRQLATDGPRANALDPWNLPFVTPASAPRAKCAQTRGGLKRQLCSQLVSKVESET